MGVSIGGIVPKEEVEFSYLQNKKIAIDAYNVLYQFLSIIRTRKGRPLKDSSGRVTSHLSGLFYRTANLIEMGLDLVYVFDGEPPDLKREEVEERSRRRKESREKYKESLEKGELEEARKMAKRSARLEDYMVEDSIELLSVMGVPVVRAPSEGEAQASFMAKRGDVWAVGSQDYDSILFGAPVVVRNITLTGRQMYPSKGMSVKLKPEVIRHDEVLSELEIASDQLIDLGILVGTDYNDGVKGIGPVRALELVKEHGRIEEMEEVKGGLDLELVGAIRRLFRDPQVTESYSTERERLDSAGVIDFLCTQRDFSTNRVEKVLDELQRKVEETSLDRWF